ncbi:hypothetical protein HMPREF9471_03945, partial [[Clostridium] clostridioforme WAL-7855]
EYNDNRTVRYTAHSRENVQSQRNRLNLVIFIVIIKSPENWVEMTNTKI